MDWGQKVRGDTLHVAIMRAIAYKDMLTIFHSLTSPPMCCNHSRLQKILIFQFCFPSDKLRKRQKFFYQISRILVKNIYLEYFRRENETTWHCHEPTYLCLEPLFYLDPCDLWPWPVWPLTLRSNLNEITKGPWNISHFPSWWPRPLTYDLDLNTWPRYHLSTSSYWIMWP